MTDFHHNIFYYYRGPKPLNHEQYDKQLEDNTTKALINTLKHCSPNIAGKFLEWLGITANGMVEFELQKPTIGKETIGRKSQRLLLGLVAVPEKKGDSICTKLEGPTNGESRPDAWLYGEDFVVLIESKVGDTLLKEDQMRCHFRKLQVDTEQQPRCQVRTWAQVYEFFKELLDQFGNELKDKWILEQFTQYLEHIGMSKFIGLEEKVFDFFITHDEDSRQKVYGTMQSLAEEILAFLPKDFLSFYDGYDVGVLHRTDKYCWVAFGPKDNKYRQWAHQTISLNADGIDVFVNVELKAATDRLKKRIHHDQQAFREIISNLLPKEPLKVRVEERKQKQASIYNYHHIATLDSDYLIDPELGPHGFDYLEKVLELAPMPYLSVARRIDKNVALELSRKDQGRSLVNETTRIMQAFHPLVKFINEEAPQTHV